MIEKYLPKQTSVKPTIYAYSDTHSDFNGMLKIGYTKNDAIKRIKEQYPIVRPTKTWQLVLEESAVRKDGNVISDFQVRNLLKDRGFKKIKGEWIKCSVNDVKAAILSLKYDENFETKRIYDFKLRPEQIEAIKKTKNYFKKIKRDNNSNASHFLWNAKMRFGKTFATYHLAKEMNWKRILVLTFKPAVQSAWKEDLNLHVDFSSWTFFDAKTDNIKSFNKKQNFVCFASFQDFLGKTKSGGIKLKNKWAHEINWDCIVFDEYHFGAWRDKAKELFDGEDKKEIRLLTGEGIDFFDEDLMPITTDHYLYLSGTPFRALTEGEFIEEQIYNWTYSDEQEAKINWKGNNNPYISLPKMILMTYQIPEAVSNIAKQGEFNEFDLNTFFSAKGKNKQASFNYENEVQKWLEFIRGSLKETSIDTLKMGSAKPPMPYQENELKEFLQHTVWFLPNISSCFAMKNLLTKRQNTFFHDYNIIVAAGNKAGMGVKALGPVLDNMEKPDPVNSKTITLSCGKLMTGITVRPWSGIFMLRNTSSLETYFQAAFRVQSPWTIKNEETKKDNNDIVYKEKCYVFDFAPNRALSLISNYCSKNQNQDEDPEKSVSEFINFLPILCFDGSSMKEIDAKGILEIVTSGTTATLLARRWKSDRLVNVDDNTLTRILNDKKAMEILSKIEGFRNINEDISTIINRTKRIKDIKKENEEVSNKQKKILTEEEKNNRNARKEIREKLLRFGTRIPVFMYLTDHREKCLKDVISEIEPSLFNKVVGISKKEFHLLLSLGVFNSILMNQSIFLFKRYEDFSLRYLGNSKHDGNNVGLWDTVISPKEFNKKPVDIS
jgi:hypothetical protein